MKNGKTNETRSDRDGEYNCEEENSRNTSRNQPISERQKESNNPTDNREIKNTEDPDGTLLQNRQEQSNPITRDMEEIKGDTKSRQSIRQTSDGVLREGSRVRNDSENLQLGEDKPNTSNIRYFSMFTGVGGFELGLERANSLSRIKEGEIQTTNEGIMSNTCEQNGNRREQYPMYKCVGMSEFDKYSNQVLKYRFPNIKNYGDCTKIKPEDLPDFDMLCGGFPCQAFSIAGKRRGFEDTRGTMFFEVARILKIKRPKIVLLENVKGLLNHNKGETFSVILQTLDELGYEIQWMVLNSKFHGVPQNRERVLIIGNLRGTSRPEILPFGTINKINNGECKEQVARCLSAQYYKQGQWEQYIQQLNNPTHSNNRIYGEDGISPALNTAQGGNRQPKIYDDYNQKMRSDNIAETLTQNTGSKAERNGQKLVDGMQIRRLTPVECCRLQGFPDDWNEWGTDDKGEVVKMSDTQKYKQMGNAVTTNVIRAIGGRILNSLNDY